VRRIPNECSAFEDEEMLEDVLDDLVGRSVNLMAGLWLSFVGDLIMLLDGMGWIR
jgi:hypothetical protein